MKTVFVPSIVHSTGRVEPLGEFLCMTDARVAAAAVIRSRQAFDIIDKGLTSRVDIFDLPADTAALDAKVLQQRLDAELRGA